MQPFLDQPPLYFGLIAQSINLFDTFNELVSSIISSCDKQAFEEYWQPRIVEITDKYLGRGNKVNQCNRTQVEAISLIVDDLQDLIQKMK